MWPFHNQKEDEIRTLKDRISTLAGNFDTLSTRVAVLECALGTRVKIPVYLDEWSGKYEHYDITSPVLDFLLKETKGKVKRIGAEEERVKVTKITKKT